MLMASKACNATSNASNQRPETPVSSPIPKVAAVNASSPNHALVQIQAQNPTIAITSYVGSQSMSSSSTIDDLARAKNVVPVLPVVSQHESSKTMDTSTPVLPKGILFSFVWLISLRVCTNRFFLIVGFFLEVNPWCLWS